LGGIFVELLRDVSFRVAPISGEEAMKMITEIKGYPLLTGFRGEEPFDVQALAEFLSRISEVMSERREIEEMDLNPVFLFKKGLVVADARIKVRSKSTKGGS
jgi:acetyl-CoA synthetase (ADP-forming)